MRKVLIASLLALVLAAPAPVSAIELNMGVGIGLKFWVDGSCGGGPCYGPGPCGGPGMAAPWYLYWPYEAHFQNPAPMGFPYYPSPQTPPPGFGGYPGMAPPGLMPMGYPASAPVYWYSR